MYLIMAEKESLRVGLATTEQRCHISDNSNIIIIKFCGGVFERLLFSLQTHSSILNLIKLRESARYKTNKNNKKNLRVVLRFSSGWRCQFPVPRESFDDFVCFSYNQQRLEIACCDRHIRKSVRDQFLSRRKAFTISLYRFPVACVNKFAN